VASSVAVTVVLLHLALEVVLRAAAAVVVWVVV
jgi:hypothetical protein